jgi:hypothetical protein
MSLYLVSAIGKRVKADNSRKVFVQAMPAQMETRHGVMLLDNVTLVEPACRFVDLSLWALR